VPFSRLWLLALMILQPFPLQCGPLPFGQALKLALNRNDAAGQADSESGRAPGASNAERFERSESDLSCPIHLQDYAGMSARLASADAMGLLAGEPSFPLAETESSGTAFGLRSRRNVILCVALIYTRLEGLAAQRQALTQQQELVTRLMDIESRRVHVDVDNPALLTEAKLLRARVRLESETLDASERKTRAALAALVGLPADDVDPVANSVPPLPDRIPATAEDEEALRLLVAYRDLVQLEYVAENQHRLKITQDMVLAKASIGRLVAAYVTEGIKFLALLQLNGQILQAKIQFLSASGALEDWAFGRGIPTAAPASSPDDGVPISILITPAVKELQAGKSQQYSAVATFANNSARDVTAEASWGCSCDAVAVLSTTGLLTGLSMGPVTVQAEFHGLKRSREVTITDQPIDEYLQPDPRSTK
jgi:hypothetical protein